jgi:hypothetical protein
MKRVNPETGKPFKCGDAREDGRLFWSYETNRKKKDGFYVEQWLTEEAHQAKKQKNNQRKYPKYQREWHLKTTYKLKLEEYQNLLEAQNSECKICKTKTPGKNRISFSVDHCHKTGKVRGLLCIKCNSLLGHAKDQIEILENAIQYLKDSEP